MKATTVRLDEETLMRVDGLAHSVHRTRTWVIKEAVERYLDYEEWYVRQVEEAAAKAGRGEFADSEEVADRFARWGVKVEG